MKTLGGAGFASQFSPGGSRSGGDRGSIASQDITTTEEETLWDLSEYGGIQINLGKGDGKIYTFILKDEKSDGKREDGREKAGINWEVDIKSKEEGVNVWKRWKDFKPYYRGKEMDDAGNLKTGQIRQLGLMMRRFV